MSQKQVGIGGKTYNIIKSSPVIEADGSKGKKYWQGHVLERNGEFFTASSSWKETGKGTSKVVWSEPYFAEPTNVGRSNERLNEAQAHFDFDSMVQKQRDKREAVKVLPMLAATFIHHTEPKKSRKDKIRYPAAIQRKYDGNRMLTDGEEAWSRGAKEVIPAVIAHILPFDTMGFVVDGELLLPGNHKINKVTSAIKKFHPGVSDTLYYVIYDVVDETRPFLERIKTVQQIVEKANNPNIVMAETLIVRNEQEVITQHERFVNEGYEGSIIRNIHGMYKPNKRVDDVQKHKDWLTEEFEIVDVIPAGGGSSANVGKFVCVNDAGDRFESTATGDEEERRDFLVNKDKYIGKFAVVKYRETSGARAVPFHSNVLEIRDTKTGGY